MHLRINIWDKGLTLMQKILLKIITFPVAGENYILNKLSKVEQGGKSPVSCMRDFEGGGGSWKVPMYQIHIE